MLNTDSEAYGRSDSSVPVYYYEAIKVTVATAGHYSLMSKSNFDIYGYIYSNTFDPSDPSVNLLSYDDDSGTDQEFKLVIFLQPGSTYVLVVTTFSPHVTGRLSIIATGPASVSLIRANITRTRTETTTRTSKD
jgi:hypothetical protein